MATYGKIEAFNGKREDLIQYIEQVEQLFLANDPTPERLHRQTMVYSETYLVQTN